MDATKKLDGKIINNYGLLIMHTASSTDPELHSLMRMELIEIVTNMIQDGDITNCPNAVIAERDPKLQTKIKDLMSASLKQIKFATPEGGLWNKVYSKR